ncbi:putative DBH-like monooxygenase protein 2 [Discoglossus pictus]
MRHIWSLLMGVFLIAGSWSDINLRLSRVLRNHRTQDTAVITWGYDREKQEVVIEIQVPTATWIGLGLNSHGNLNGSDMVIGGWDENDENFFYDAHMEGQWPPVEDKSQDYELVDLRDNGTHSFMRVWRKFFTCDPHDLNIENDTVRVFALYGEDDELEYSEERTFTLSMLFLEIVLDIKLGKNIFTYDLKLTDFHIPAEDTTYTCTFLPLPTLTKKHHIVKYETRLSPTSENIVHHILIYSCTQYANITSEVSDCYGSDTRFSQCREVMFGWAVGGEEFYFPEFAGLPIGSENDPKYIRIEIHFSNFNNIEGLVDNSGIRFYYTPDLRKYDCGILMTGVFTFPVQFIPPGAQDFRTYGLCNTDLIPQVIDVPMEEMVVSAYLLHGHLTTNSIRVMHYRNGTLIGSLGEDKNYDFSLQQIRYLPVNATIKLGDQILVECTGTTLDREEVTFVSLTSESVFWYIY